VVTSEPFQAGRSKRPDAGNREVARPRREDLVMWLTLEVYLDRLRQATAPCGFVPELQTRVHPTFLGSTGRRSSPPPRKQIAV